MTKFVISAGHSNTDPGAKSNGTTEASIVTDFRDLLASHLYKLGHFVVTDGLPGESWALKDAIKLIQPGDIAVEFHCNAATNAKATGVESIASADSPHKELCQKLSNAIAGVLDEKVRGDNGYIDPSRSARGKLGWCDAGGIIVELFFLTNEKDLATYHDRKYQVVRAVAEVLCQYAGQ